MITAPLQRPIISNLAEPVKGYTGFGMRVQWRQAEYIVVAPTLNLLSDLWKRLGDSDAELDPDQCHETAVLPTAKLTVVV